MNELIAIVVDDQIENVNVLKYLVEKYCPQIRIVSEAYNTESAIELIDQLKPDIIFLDIQLEEGLSFDILDKVSFKESKVVFVTGYDEYAVKAFKYNAVDYLLKPIDIQDLIRISDKITRSFENKENNLLDQVKDLKRYVREIYSQEFITIPSIKKIDIIKISDILYVKSESKFSAFITDKGEIISSKNLGIYENLLPKFKFFRVHNSYIINLDRIERIHKSEDYYCLMQNGKKIPISRRKYSSFMRIMDPSS